ncbi:MAG: nitroreductase family protein [Treponema sp.]|nr:nitroreductase family protein [Treponema sp.]
MIDAIKYRTSYRGKYKNEAVPRENLKMIMEAGLAAPSGCNGQTTSLVAVDDAELLEQIRPLLKRVGTDAPAMIFVLTEKIPTYHGNCYNVQDYAAAIENMLLEIVDLGYESCWVEGYMTDEKDGVGKEIAKILKLESKYELVCYLPVGKAEDEIKHIQKKSFEERAWFNIR